MALDHAGAVRWFSYMGGKGKTQVRDLLPLPNTNLLAVGHTDAEKFPLASSMPGTQEDVFAQQITHDDGQVAGSLHMRLVVPGRQVTHGRAAIDASGQVFVGGSTTSAFDPALMRRGFDSSFAQGGGDGFVLALDVDLTQPHWGAYVGGDTFEGGVTNAPDEVRALALDATGSRLFIGGASAARDVLHPGKMGYELQAREGVNGFLFAALQDPTPPTGGEVHASLDAAGHITARWEDFEDKESGIAKYEWSITDSEQATVRDFAPVSDGHATAETLVLKRGERYFVHVRATNGVGCGVTVTAEESVGLESLPGTPGEETPGGETPGEPPPGPEVPGLGDPRSPLGWGCGVTHPGTLPGALGLVLLGLFGARRARRGAAPRA